MLLSDRDIHRAIKDKHIIIDPFDPTLVQPASVDVRLSDKFRIFRSMPNVTIDPQELDEDELVAYEPVEYFIIEPNAFVLASTIESVGVNAFHAAQVGGKSSLARIGLLVHATAGFIDPGFNGQITLELSNVGPRPIMLRPGMKIAQVTFTLTTTKVDRPYGTLGLGSHYQGQRGPTAAHS